MSLRMARVKRRLMAGSGAVDGKGDEEFGPFVEFALDGDFAAVFPDDAACDWQAQTRAAVFGGEKWFEESSEVFRRDAHAGIRHGDVKMGAMFASARSRLGRGGNDFS